MNMADLSTETIVEGLINELNSYAREYNELEAQMNEFHGDLFDGTVDTSQLEIMDFNIRRIENKLVGYGASFTPFHHDVDTGGDTRELDHELDAGSTHSMDIDDEISIEMDVYANDYGALEPQLSHLDESYLSVPIEPRNIIEGEDHGDDDPYIEAQKLMIAKSLTTPIDQDDELPF